MDDFVPIRLPPPQVKQLGELGLMGVAIDTESGGAGLDYLVSCSPSPAEPPPPVVLEEEGCGGGLNRCTVVISKA